MFWFKDSNLTTVPKEYLDQGGYRRLAVNETQLEKGKCWCCRWAVAFRTWWCEVPGDVYCGVNNNFKHWKPCYVKNQITKRSYKNGLSFFRVGGWIGIPPFKNQNIKEGSIPYRLYNENEK